MRIAALQQTDESRLLHVLRKTRVSRWDAVADTRELKLREELELSVL